MDIDALRERNEQKAEEEKERGPVSAEPDSSPMGEAIADFHERGALPFGIPAHRAGTGAVVPDAAEWAGMGAFEADPGMNNGVDDRHQSWQVETTAMELFAKAVGADQTLFSTNGTTLNVHVALLTVAQPGEKVVMARNGHKSAFAGLVLAGVEPVYVDPVYDDDWQVAHGVDPAALEAALEANPDARAAMVFTPSYYGYSADVAGLAAAAHAHDVPLVTDDAWGLDYSFCSRLPPSALESGADLALGSVHKTLAGLGQTSVLSVQGERIDTERLQMVFELEQSTSAAALLILSIDATRRQFVREGEELLGAAVDRSRRLRATIEAIPGLTVMPESIAPSAGAVAVDPTHVCVDVKDLGLTGFSAADWLREHRRIHVELADHRRILALISYADDDQNLERLAQALLDLSDHHAEADPAPDFVVPPIADLRLPTEMLPREAYLGNTEDVPWRQAAGRISAEMVCPYPPGIPICAPGERLSTEVVEYLEQVIAAGGMVEGAADEALETFRVVA
jgi:arginine/lysine/ornithine decarboxylase